MVFMFPYTSEKSYNFETPSHASGSKRESLYSTSTHESDVDVEVIDDESDHEREYS